MTEEEISQHWHLDKRVPIALIFAILVQTAAIFMWVGALSSRVSELEIKANRAMDIGDRVIRVESDVSYMRNSVERIEKKLDTQKAH